MGTWNTKINGSDAFLDIYNNFFVLYNQGTDPKDASRQIQEDFSEMFHDHDDRNNSLFGLALAQWETKALDPGIFQQVKEIITSGNDLEVWSRLGADTKTVQTRKSILDKFLSKISAEKEKPKRRVKPKYEFTHKDLISITAPDGQKTFTLTEHFTNGVYTQTGSMLLWGSGGCSVLYFIGQGKHISAKWLDGQTLKVTHQQDIVFTKKNETFFYCGDQGKVIYIPTDMYPIK